MTARRVRRKTPERCCSTQLAELSKPITLTIARPGHVVIIVAEVDDVLRFNLRFAGDALAGVEVF